MYFAGCQVEGLPKNEKMTPFLQKKWGKMNILTKKMKKKKKILCKGNLKIYFSIKTETNTEH